MIPIKTSLRPRSTPYANYMLIAINVAIFLVSYNLFEKPRVYDRESGRMVEETLRQWAQQFMLTPTHPYIWQFVTYAFLHGSWMHIIGNMYFLYLFGNNVNDRLGNVGYLCLYLAGAVFSGIGHTLLHVNPVLGASGAVAAITGAYLVLFPKTLITVIYILFYIWDIIEIRALYFIAFKLIFWDNIIEPKFSSQAVAYDAHLAGYAFGIVAILILLAIRLIESDHDNLWAIVRQWNRRRAFRNVVSDNYSPFEPTLKKTVPSTIREDTPDQASAEINEMRGQVIAAMVSKNTLEASKLYAELLKQDSGQTFSQKDQLDLANTLMSDGRWESAAKAYENYLAVYQNNAEQVQLMLGLLYTRYILNPDRARQLLGKALEKLTQPNQIQMCKDLLAEMA